MPALDLLKLRGPASTSGVPRSGAVPQFAAAHRTIDSDFEQAVLSITLHQSLDSASAPPRSPASPVRSAEHDTISEYAGFLTVPQSFLDPSQFSASQAESGDPSAHFENSSDIGLSLSARSSKVKVSARSSKAERKRQRAREGRGATPGSALSGTSGGASSSIMCHQHGGFSDTSPSPRL